ncbi:MAG: DUF1572 family protein [Bacteroidetes bacterium]|nr:DUF1572 family protein [Bacteroidota bacterium]
MHMIAALQASFLEGLSALSDEIRSFPDDASLWVTRPGITNSAGTLALHLIGNLHHFVGAQIGNTGYVRDREAEFAARDLTKAMLLQRCDETTEMIRTTFRSCTAESLAHPFPLATFGEGRTTGDVLVRLVAHFRYHLGQVNYLRRLL